MSVISSLIVSLGMESAAFTSGVKEAKTALSGLDSALAGVATAAAAIGIGVGFKSLVSSALDSIDATAKVSDRLGVTTQSLIGLRHAANLSGVGMEQFDATLEKMTKTLGGAADGTGPAAEALATIGLDAKKLAGQAPDEAFKSISEAISGIENPAQRAAIATALFGKQGQELLNTMMGGRAALDAAAEEATKLGLAYSRIDAAKVEEANDAFTNLEEVVKGVGQQIAISLAPALKTVFDFIKNTILFFTKWGSTIRDVVVAVATFRVALWAIVAVQKAIAAAQAIVLSLSGPAGWAQLAAGAVIAVAATAAVAHSFSSIETGAASAVVQTEKLGTSLTKLQQSAQQRDFRLGELKQDVQALKESLSEKLDTFGLSDTEKKIHALQKEMRANLLLNPQEGHEWEVIRSLEAAHKLKEEQAAQDKKDQSRAKELIEQSLSAQEKFVSFQQELNSLRRKGLIDQQKANALLADAAKARDAGIKAEKEAAKNDLNKLGEKLREQTETPLQKFLAKRAEIDQAFKGRELSHDQRDLLDLQNAKALIEAMPDKAAAGPQRAAALERGTAAAFSASFGSDPLTKKQEELLKIEREMLKVQNRIESKLGVHKI